MKVLRIWPVALNQLLSIQNSVSTQLILNGYARAALNSFGRITKAVVSWVPQHSLVRCVHSPGGASQSLIFLQITIVFHASANTELRHTDCCTRTRGGPRYVLAVHYTCVVFRPAFHPLLEGVKLTVRRLTRTISTLFINMPFSVFADAAEEASLLRLMQMYSASVWSTPSPLSSSFAA